MFLLADFLIDALAVHRVTRLATRDEITENIRKMLEAEIELTRTTGIISQGLADKLTYVLRCDWCASIWIAMTVAALKKYIPDVWGKIRLVLAASTVTGMIASYE